MEEEQNQDGDAGSNEVPQYPKGYLNLPTGQQHETALSIIQALASLPSCLRAVGYNTSRNIPSHCHCLKMVKGDHNEDLQTPVTIAAVAFMNKPRALCIEVLVQWIKYSDLLPKNKNLANKRTRYFLLPGPRIALTD